MKPRQFVAYYRVSTSGQEQSGLGLEAQANDVQRYIAGAQGKLVAAFTEVKRGSRCARPQLAEALRICRMRRAVLIIARLDRLARNLALIASLMDSDIEFVVADFPQASRLTLHVLAAIAEYESKLVSDRTTAAFAAARARGVKIGGHQKHGVDMRAAVAASVIARRAKVKARAMDLAPTIWAMRAEGKTLDEIADELTRQKIRAPKRGPWEKQGIVRILKLTASEFPSLAEAVAASPGHRPVRAQERAEGLAPLVWRLKHRGQSLTSIAEEMNRRQVWTPRGGRWHSSGVLRILRRTAGDYAPPEEAEAITLIGRRGLHARRRARDLGPLLWELRSAGLSCAAIGKEFTRRNIRAPCGGKWHPSVVRTLLLQTAAGHASGSDPHGTDRLGRDPGRAKKRSLRTAPIIWELKAEGRSIAAIADELNRRGMPSPRGRRWHHDAVKQVLNLTAVEFASFAEAAANQPPPHVIRAKERARDLAPTVWDLRSRGLSLAAIADELTRQGLPTPSGKRKWFVATVWNLLRLTVDDFPPSVAKAAALPNIRSVRAGERAMKAPPIARAPKRDGQPSAAVAAELDQRNITTPRGRRRCPSSPALMLRATAADFAYGPDALQAHSSSPQARKRRRPEQAHRSGCAR